MAKLLLTSGFLLFLRIGAYLCLEFNADADTVKGATVSLVCTIDPASFTTFIFLTKDGGSKTSCDNANVCTPASSDAGRYVYSSNSSAVTVTITSLNHTSDAGIWRCTLGTTSTLKDYTLEIQSVPGTVVIQQTIPEANVTTNVKRVDLSATCYCIFPAPTEVDVLYKFGTGGSYQILQRVSTPTPSTGSSCLSYEFEITVSNYTISVDDHAVLSGKTDVYLQVQFGQYTTAGVGPFQFAVSAPTPDECKDRFQYSLPPVLIITLFGTLFIVVFYRVIKNSKLLGSLKKICGCCPQKNQFCMAVCPLCTDPLCAGSKNKGCKLVLSAVLINVAGLAIGLGLGISSIQCDLIAGLSSLCGFVLVAIFAVSVYPHWPENGEDDSTEPDNPDVIIKPAENPDVITTPEEGTKSYINCFMPCRVNPSQDTIKTDENNSGKKNPKKKPEGNQASPNRETERKTDENNSGKKNPKREPAENQASPNRETPRSPQATASASGIELMTAEGRSPRPLENPRALPAIVSEAKQPTPISNEESTLKKKPLNTALPETPKPNKLPPMDTVNNEEDKPQKKKKKKEKKKRGGEENGGDDKRDSQNSGGQANVEEEEQK